MKRYEVRINLLTAFVFPQREQLVRVQQFRWLWCARLACIVVNRASSKFGFYRAYLMRMKPVVDISVEDSDDLPSRECPQCHDVQPDLDGFGTLHCVACGYCKHASVTDGVCGFCGKKVRP
jgi:hypothetical protein